MNVSGEHGLELNGQNGADAVRDCPAAEKPRIAVGYLDVFVHHARDIHNICIYHKQDVYAKVCLTGDPESSRATKTINGGGQNPVFNDSVRIMVYNVETKVRCEVWMLSRVQNYLQDQLLGIALVPLADVLVAENAKLEREFSLSSTDLFHSPAGFLRLSLSYVGYSPEVIPVSPPAKPALHVPEIDDPQNGDLVHSEFENLEFPDLNVATENEIMVSEYIKIPCSIIETPSADRLTIDVNGKHSDDEGEACAGNNLPKKNEEFGNDSPLSCVSTADSSALHPSTPLTVSEPSSNTIPSSPNQKDKIQEITDGEADSPVEASEATAIEPVISIRIEQPEVTVMQQDIVDMYMKSMQQFTESLAKMKLPMDIGSNGNSNSNGNSSQSTSPNSETKDTPKGTGQKVFYGSRAFF